MTGYFISFEGGDGVGKSTQARLLAHWLGDATGREVVLTREPGGTDLGRVLREAVLHGDHVDPRAEALLYAADRAHHVATLVQPALDRGDSVVTDRYLDSSVAYQGGGRELAADDVEGLSRWATRGLLPDATVLLDVDPEVARRRRAGAEGKGAPDRLESAGDAFAARVRATFLSRAAADPGRWAVIDASAGVAEVGDEVRREVAARLGLGTDGPGSTDAAGSPRRPDGVGV